MAFNVVISFMVGGFLLSFASYLLGWYGRQWFAYFWENMGHD